jgi:hypothetical protein
MNTNILGFSDFDEESQKELQGMNFLKWDGVQEKGESSLDKIRINKDSFNENGVSIITDFKWNYLKRSSIDIERLFFKNNVVETINEFTFIQEPGCNCNINIKEIPVYRPRGKEGFQLNVDEYLFKIKIFTSTRGDVIKRAYFDCKEKDDEALFFIEDNTGDVSKAKIYAKFGKKVLKDVLINIKIDAKTPELILQKYTGLNTAILTELIQNGVYEESSSVVKTFVTGFYSFMAYIGLPMKALGWVCEKLGEGIIEYLSLPENIWNSSDTNYFLKKDKILETLIINPKIVGDIKESLKNDPTKFEFNDLLPDFILNNIDLGLTSIELLINNYNNYVFETINSLYDDNELSVNLFDLQNHVSEKVAFLCGIWNGLIDFIGGLFVFIGGIAQIQYNVGSNLDDYLEQFDNLCKVIKDLKQEDVNKEFDKVFDQIKKYLKDNSDTDYNQDKLAYISGFGLAFIGTMFIPFTAFAKPLGVINKFKKALVPTELLEKVSKASAKTSNFVVKAGKEASSTALKFISDIVNLLEKGAKGIGEFLQNIWKKIAEWFVENKKAFIKRLTLVNDANEFIKFYTLTTAKHINYGEIRIQKINPKLSKKDPKRVLEVYSYTPKNGKIGKTGVQYKSIVGGMHNLNNLNRYVRLVGKLELVGKLPSGEKVYKGIVEFWIKEQKKWSIPKTSTFFPKKWSEGKIRKVIEEASMNITFKDRNRYIGITNEGIQIEMWINQKTKEIETAYITFEKIN